MVVAELAMAFFRGIFRISCWAGTARAPPPMPRRPAIRPMGRPTVRTFQVGIFSGMGVGALFFLVMRYSR